MDEGIQRIQPLLITRNERQFYFWWKPPDRDGFVETNAASFIAISCRKTNEYYHAQPARTHTSGAKDACVYADNTQTYKHTHSHIQIQKIWISGKESHPRILNIL